MGIKDIFSRERKPLDAPETIDGDGVSPIASELDGNVETRKKQQMKLAVGCGVVLVASSFWIFGGDDAVKKIDPDSADRKTVSVSDMTNKTKSEQEWMAQSENRFQSNENQLKGVEGTNARVAQLAEQLDAMRAQNQSMSADGQRVVSAYQAENDQLRRQVNERAAAPAPVPGPQAMYGPGSAALYGNLGATGPGPASAPARLSEVKMVSFGSAETGNASKVSKGNTVYTDSPNYLPANSFASAKVVVGVDASAGVNSQSDPLPVVLRITGPARSVLQNGKLLTTKIQGCLINGAARGDLSSEKVYIKLQKMTCPQPGGRYAESEVKGFIAFGGKTGVRGRVVSREGSLAMQAFFAGLVGGAGSALNQAFNAPVATISANGSGSLNHTPNLGNVGLRALGGGAQESGKDLGKYLIERAEQYQPVIEMPTGVDVEIVFLEGVYVRN
ncbi:conjugal transfer pilus assembly protein TraB [Sphingomonas sp. PP-F2F-A104-K0414]|uniref:TraB/VirB10 family protein n=1 Tax=Sphingomonas sp. PP-F2F-A104-K0414 TaxID=2135661 RepID=UPI00104C91C8|nr:TraB/VirB10 family protein [Sphingomonas sp. PP-F2F-A104-K0414]TCP97543.1 conjugal transfer pilus assembly protein TraB [Sphingomonas sp. PP-F2F-A104-K0414]